MDFDLSFLGNRGRGECDKAARYESFLQGVAVQLKHLGRTLSVRVNVFQSVNTQILYSGVGK